MRLVVYGTLRKGGALASYLDPLRLHRDVKVNVEEIAGLKMFSLDAYPAAIKTSNTNDKIVAEVIEAPVDKYTEQALLRTLDIVEGVPFNLYRRDQIETSLGKALIYIYNQPVPSNARRITDWSKGV